MVSTRFGCYKCIPRNSSRTGELFEALSDPEKVFNALNCANKKGKQQQNSTKQIETDMDDGIENLNNRNNANDSNNQGVVPLVPEAALYDLNKGLFSGSYIEDPQQHLKNFLSKYVTQRKTNVTPEAIKLLLFPFSVTIEAQTWLNSLPINSITTWEELVKQFLNKFYPHNKTAKQIDEILSYRQRRTETLQETWERFKGILVKCPHHGIPYQMLGQRFYMGLADILKANVDASAGGAFFSKSFRECKILLDKMAQNSGWMTRDSTITHIDVCSWSAESDNQQYQEDMNYVVNYGGQRQGGQNWGQQNQQYRPAQQQYNNGNNPVAMRPQGQVVPYQRQHGYNQQNQQLAYQQPQQQQIVRQEDVLSEIKGMLQRLIGSNGKMQERVDAHESAIKGIEIQLGQISMALNNRPQGTLPADTQVNPKKQGSKQLMAVSLRNGRDLDLEQEIARESRPTETLVPVPIEVDDSTGLTEVMIQHAQESTSKEKEVAKESEVAQETTVEAVPKHNKTQIIGRK
ncbi:uncharacterized protein [Nicotiana tomentosiformis]|uniref:uncharacterized protein n=1 Tax=Nicotiana tomentosiformis TaxID=4098 RepID=UPI00388CE45A